MLKTISSPWNLKTRRTRINADEMGESGGMRNQESLRHRKLRRDLGAVVV